jgi:hypothetical protein
LSRKKYEVGCNELGIEKMEEPFESGLGPEGAVAPSMDGWKDTSQQRSAPHYKQNKVNSLQTNAAAVLRPSIQKTISAFCMKSFSTNLTSLTVLLVQSNDCR